MTISANYEPIEYIGNGVARNFVPPFKFFDDEIVVTINGNITKAYEILNGTVIFNTAPADGAVIVFKRNVPLSQEVTFIEGENFPANDFEYSLDRLYMALQELKYNLEKAKEEAEDDPSGDIDGRIEALTTSINIINGKLLTAESDIDNVEEDVAVAKTDIENLKAITSVTTRKVIPSVVVSVDMWQEDTRETGYSYSAEINCVDTDNDNMDNPLWTLVPTVVFAPEQADSGNFSTYVTTEIKRAYDTGYSYGLFVTIYAKEKPTEEFYIPTIKLD